MYALNEQFVRFLVTSGVSLGQLYFTNVFQANTQRWVHFYLASPVLSNHRLSVESQH